MQYFGAISKNERMISVRFQGKPVNIKVIQVYASTTNAKEAEVEWFCEDLQGLLELTHTHTQKKKPQRCDFHHQGLECKSRKSEIHGVTGKFGFGVQNEAGQRLTEFCQENTLVIANTLFQQHKRRLYTWTSPDSKY